MYNPYSLYLIGKTIQADRLREAERERLIEQARVHRQEEGGDRSLILGLVARAAIVIALGFVLNIV